MGPRVLSETSTLRGFDDDLDREFANTMSEGLTLMSSELSCFRKEAATTTGRLQTIRETQFFKWDPMI
jgi:hypothetical protein